jgi:WD40 repeat protein
MRAVDEIKPLRVAFSPGGSSPLVAAHGLGYVSISDPESGELRRLFQAHSKNATGIDVDPYGARFVTCSDDSLVKVWSLDGCDLVHELAGHEVGVNDVHFSPDGQQIASGSEDGTIRVWDAETGEQTQTLTGHEGSIHDIAFHHGGNLLASASLDGTVKLWDAAAGTMVASLEKGDDEFLAVAFSSDGTRLAAAGQEGIIRLIDPKSCREVAQLHGHAGAVYSLEFGPEDRMLVSTSRDGTIRLWEVPSSLDDGNRRRGPTDHVASMDGARRLLPRTENRREQLADVPRTVTAPGVTDSSGLVGWWPGDGNAQDYQGKNHGKLMNGATTAPGKFAQAFAFDGLTEVVTIDDDPALNFGTHSFTVSAWVCAAENAPPSTSLHRGIVSKRNGLIGRDFGWSLHLTVSKCEVEVCSPGPVRGCIKARSDDTVEAGGFEHLAFVVDRRTNTLKLYVGGVLQSKQPSLASVGDLSSPDPVRIGRGPFRAVSERFFPFHGLIDDVRIFGLALSAEEIQGICNSPGEHKDLSTSQP